MSSIGSIGFTAGGIDVTQIVSGLMDVERQPIVNLQNKQAAVKLQSDALGRLKTTLSSLRSQAAALIATGGFTKFSSSVSAPGIASATVGTGALPGSITFVVDQLARAHGIRSAGTVASNTSVVTTKSTLAVSTTARQIGASAVSADPAVATGSYTVTVTQSTAGATRSGTAALAASTVIGAGNNTLQVEVDGVAKNVTIANGTYTAAQLETAVQAGLDAVGAAADASIDNSGRLVLTTTHEGSTATLKVTGGTALTDLRLAVDVSAATGVDGSVKIGTNAATTVTSAGTGGTISVATGSGNLNLTLADGLRAGDATVAVVSTGDRSLGAVAAAINGANVGASAAAVKVADGAWLLQLSSTATGADRSLVVDANGLDLAGGYVETSAAQDARITIGSGPGAYSVESSSNSFSDVLPGVTISALAESTTPVTVTVARDDGAIADSVGRLVEKVSAVLAEIAMQTKFDTKTKKSSPLSGDAAVKAMSAELRSAVTALVGGASTSLASSIGINTQRDGSITFDRAKFLTALQADPAGVERLFSRGGTTTGSATFGSASDKTIAGTYAVNVTTAGTRATSGEVLVGGSPLGQVIGVRVGGVTATYTATAGATAADITAGLNASLAAAGLAVNAETTVGGGVKLTAVSYGAAGSFDVNLDVAGAGSWAAQTGTDVAGTIDGKAAVGIGNTLSLLDTDTSLARGLVVNVAEGVTGAVGNVDYTPGIAARLVSLADRLTGTGGGLTTSTSTYDSKIKTYTDQIAKYEDRLITKEAQLRRQWTAVQNLLSSLQSQQDWLAGQVKSLQAK